MARDTRDLGSLPLGVAIGLRNGLCHKEQLFPLAPSATPVEGWVGGWVGGWEAQIPPTLGPSPWASVPWASVPFLRLSKTQLLREVGGGLRSVCVKAFVWSHFWAAASQIKPRSLWVEPGQGAEGASVFHKPFPWGSPWGKRGRVACTDMGSVP